MSEQPQLSELRGSQRKRGGQEAGSRQAVQSLEYVTRSWVLVPLYVNNGNKKDKAERIPNDQLLSVL